MRLWLLLFFAVLMMMAVGVLFFKDPGSVQLSFQAFHHEYPLWLAVIAFFCVNAFLTMIVLFLGWMADIPQRWRMYQQRRQSRRALSVCGTIFQALIDDQPESCMRRTERELLQSFDLLPAPYSFDYFTIWFWIHQGRYDEAHALLRRLEPTFVLDILRAESLYAQKKYTEAQEVLIAILTENRECLSIKQPIYKKGIALLWRTMTFVHEKENVEKILPLVSVVYKKEEAYQQFLKDLKDSPS
jgi:tetratricopeptide (TPR) repeat protein